MTIHLMNRFMNFFLIVYVVVFSTVFGFDVTKRETSGSYTAASVMHTPVALVRGNSRDDIIESNLRMYEGYTQQVTSGVKKADIIVFPESGTGFLQVPPPLLRVFCEPVPAPGFVENNCTTWNTTIHPHASWASCMSRKYDIDMLINYCENSTEADPSFPGQNKAYNVDVGFTKDGRLGAEYRKSHITGTGPTLSQPAKPDVVVFTSSFGVRFSMFTCYDLWFLEPMHTAMVELGITDFLFPNEMSSGPPYFVIPETQAGWSLAHNINLISATSLGSGGAGVYHKGTAVAVNRLLPHGLRDAHSVVVGTLPKIATHKDPVSFRGGVEQVTGNTHVAVKGSLSNQETSLGTNSGNATTCTYGPHPYLNYTFNCVAFDPNVASSFDLKVNGSYRGLNAPIECQAAIQTKGSTKKKWYLGAIDIYYPPTVATPSSAVNSMCLIFHCDDNVNGCMGMAPWEGWETDLHVESIVVSGTFGGIFNSSTTSVYPHYGFATGSDTGNSTDFNLALPSREGVLYRSRMMPQEVQYTVGTTSFMSSVVTDSFLYSFGIYATAFSGLYKP